jgi:isopenicillin N synthase-like dioxygenase
MKLLDQLTWKISCVLCWLAIVCQASSDYNEKIQPVVPLIDLQPWIQNTSERTTVVDQIAESCRSVGFFMIVNHGVDLATLDRAWNAMHAFFDLEIDEKQSWKTEDEAEYPYGYEQSETLVKGKDLDGVMDNGTNEDHDTSDLKETFAVGPNNLDSGMPRRQWLEIDKEKVPQFQQALEDYYAQMEHLSLTLLRIFALGLDQPMEFFESTMTHHMSALRLVHYYPLDPPMFQDEVVRAGAHTDYGIATILNARQPGLQVLTTDQSTNQTIWHSVPNVPGALVINLGDLMERWTNGKCRLFLMPSTRCSAVLQFSKRYAIFCYSTDKWTSTLHRVVMPSNEDMQRRYSMAFFVNVNGDTTVEPLDSCLDVSRKSKYPPIYARNHLMAKHLASMGGTATATSTTADQEEL